MNFALLNWNFLART